jgi:hypothetical protein
MSRFVGWNELPRTILRELEQCRVSAVIEAARWILATRPGGLDEDGTSIAVLWLWRRFGTAAGASRMGTVANWVRYLGRVGRNASLRHTRARDQSLRLDATGTSAVDPDKPVERAAARELLERLPVVAKSLSPAEKRAFGKLMDDILTPSRQKKRESTTRGRDATARYRVRASILRKLSIADANSDKRKQRKQR